MQRLMQLQNPRLANINPSSLIDTTFVRKLDETGFIGKLQARYGELSENLRKPSKLSCIVVHAFPQTSLGKRGSPVGEQPRKGRKIKW